MNQYNYDYAGQEELHIEPEKLHYDSIATNQEAIGSHSFSPAKKEEAITYSTVAQQNRIDESDPYSSGTLKQDENTIS